MSDALDWNAKTIVEFRANVRPPDRWNPHHSCARTYAGVANTRGLGTLSRSVLADPPDQVLPAAAEPVAGLRGGLG
jgi:hypothetical protein